MKHYLIWSHEHGAWWRPNSRGYSETILDAGVYSEEESAAIVKGSGGRECRYLFPEEVVERRGHELLVPGSVGDILLEVRR